MIPRRNKSRKRSAASSSEKPLDFAVFFLDESIYSRVLREELEQLGLALRLPGIDVPLGTPDTTWLGMAGANGWIVLMRDQRVRHRALELQALRAAKVGAFVFTAGQATAQDTARVIATRLTKILNISRSERKPFLYTIGITGALSRVKIR